MQPGTIILHNSLEFDAEKAEAGAWLAFREPIEVLETAAMCQIPALLRRIDEETRRGRWAAGFFGVRSGAGIRSRILRQSRAWRGAAGVVRDLRGTGAS